MYLGICYHNGNGTRKNYKKAVYWLKLSAKESESEAQYFLALSYLDGDGVTKNKRMANYWLKKAAAAGNEQAIAHLAQ
jgi:hypothetical protein